MHNRMISISIARRLSGYFLIGFVAFLFIRAPISAEVAQLPLEGGFDLAVIEAPIKSAGGDSKVTILRIVPNWFRLHLISAKLLKSENRPARAKVYRWLVSSLSSLNVRVGSAANVN